MLGLRRGATHIPLALLTKHRRCNKFCYSHIERVGSGQRSLSGKNRQLRRRLHLTVTALNLCHDVPHDVATLWARESNVQALVLYRELRGVDAKQI
jgi:hypothetical protein